MGFYKQTKEEKILINLVKIYLYLYPYWRREYSSTREVYKKGIILLNIFFVETFILTKENRDIFLPSISTRNKGLEYIAYSLYYSESGLRNKINILIIQVLDIICNTKFIDYSIELK